RPGADRWRGRVSVAAGDGGIVGGRLMSAGAHGGGAVMDEKALRDLVETWRARRGLYRLAYETAANELDALLRVAINAELKDCEHCVCVPPGSARQPIETAPKDGAVIDVWRGDAIESDRQFYCTPGTRRAPGWTWVVNKWRPMTGLGTVLS